MAGLAAKVLTLSLALTSSLACAATIREERKVIVDGGEESWALVWRSTPSDSICGLSEPLDSFTCPCSGFAYAQSGHLSLRRKIPGREPESLDLDDLFLRDGTPGADTNKQSLLAKWPQRDGDSDRVDDDPLFREEIRRRKAVSVLNFADYDHDGKASEFLLQVGTWPCGKHYMVAVGAIGAARHLGVIRTMEHPERPLVLPESAWKALLNGDLQGVVEWECDDHGSEVQQILHVAAQAGHVTAERHLLSCSSDPAHSAMTIEKL
jgi:hypothetical protein